MKRGTETLPKFLDLCERLELPKYAAVGLLQTLWSITAESTPRGDIGLFSDAQIAKRLEWQGDPGKLVEALVASKWLDLNDACRLYVHDWHVHAEDFIHRKLARGLQTFADGTDPNLTRLSKEERAGYEAKLKRAPDVRPKCAPALALASALDLSHYHNQIQQQSEQAPTIDGEEEIYGTFPTLEGDWPFCQSNLDVLEAAYSFEGHQDWVFNECKAAKAWLLSNPTKLKTKRGMMKFLNGWLKKAYDAGGPDVKMRRDMARAGQVDRQQKKAHMSRNGHNVEPESITAVLEALT